MWPITAPRPARPSWCVCKRREADLEANTYAASAYIATGADAALAYLSDLANLEHWTLGTRVHKQIDATTWVGSVTSSPDPLYFHVQETTGFPVPTFEWQMGREPGRYTTVHRWLIIPASLAHPGNDAAGVYVHWLSFSNPARRTVLADLGYDRIIHQTEIRHLKAVLERAQGLRAPASASHRLCTASLYVNAPASTLSAYLGTLANVPKWARMWPQMGTVSADSALFTDAYLQPLLVTSRASTDADMALLTLQVMTAPSPDKLSSTILSAILPCAHVFGDPDASGCVLHRIAFAPQCGHAAGPHDPRDLFAESLAIKRHVELLAGHPESFAQGYSYQPSDEQLV